MRRAGAGSRGGRRLHRKHRKGWTFCCGHTRACGVVSAAGVCCVREVVLRPEEVEMALILRWD